MNTDAEVIIIALRKEREELHQRLMQIDRIIDRVNSLEYDTEIVQLPVKEIANNKEEKPLAIFANKADIRVQVLMVFDLIKQAAKLKDIQEKYSQISGNKYNIREIVRTLHKARLVTLVKQRSNERGFMWIKTDWLVNGQLADQYKPEGFDMLYKPENLIFE